MLAPVAVKSKASCCQRSFWLPLLVEVKVFEAPAAEAVNPSWIPHCGELAVTRGWQALAPPRSNHRVLARELAVSHDRRHADTG